MRERRGESEREMGEEREMEREIVRGEKGREKGGDRRS